MRRLIVILIVAMGLVGLLAAPAGAVASPYVLTDPSGDAPHGAKTDILKVTITHRATVTIAIKMGATTGFTNWGTNGNLDNIQIHFFPNDPYIAAGRNAVALFNGESTVPGCPVTRSRNATTNKYVFTVARSCLGNPTKLKVFVLAGAHGSTSISESDRAPASGFTAGVTVG